MTIEAGVRSAIRRAVLAGKVRYLSDIPGFSDLPRMTMQIFLHERLTASSNAEALRRVGMSENVYQRWRDSNKTFIAVYDQVIDRTHHIEVRNLPLMLDRTIDKLGYLLERSSGEMEDERLHGMYLKTIKELRTMIREDGQTPKSGKATRKGFEAVRPDELAPMPTFDENGRYILGSQEAVAPGDADEDEGL